MPYILMGKDDEGFSLWCAYGVYVPYSNIAFKHAEIDPLAGANPRRKLATSRSPSPPRRRTTHPQGNSPARARAHPCRVPTSPIGKFPQTAIAARSSRLTGRSHRRIPRPIQRILGEPLQRDEAGQGHPQSPSQPAILRSPRKQRPQRTGRPQWKSPL